MKYAVVWKPSAEQELAAVWLASSDQADVTAAADELERQIARAPLTTGESRESSLRRVVYRPPVGIVYEVIPDDARVNVLSAFAVG